MGVTGVTVSFDDMVLLEKVVVAQEGGGGGRGGGGGGREKLVWCDCCVVGLWRVKSILIW